LNCSSAAADSSAIVMNIWYRTASSESSVSSQHLYSISKRLFDLVLSLVCLLLLLPMLAFIALLIKIDSSGPVFFVQTRIGKGGRPFKILKFRTMKNGLSDPHHRAFMQAFVRGEISSTQAGLNNPSPRDADPQRQSRLLAEKPDGDKTRSFKPFHKSQVTRLGRFLRKTSLDELPQLLNVLAGNMSLVGPRPNVPWEVEEYKPWHRKRLSVLPGITGLAQVNGRSCLDFDTIVRYDIEYIQRANLWLDLWILVQTVSRVLDGQGAR
jgi:lipopolysaccharide/colanic/teichoic acid biosynthesis glycosyltransferase